MCNRNHVHCWPAFVWASLVILTCSVGAQAQALKLNGTPTCFRAMLQISEEYTKRNQGTEFNVRYSGSFAAVEQLGSGKIDIAFIEHPLRKYVDDAWAKAFPEGRGPAAEHTFAQTALGVVVNKRNSLAKLTRDQLRDVCSAKITLWREVGGSGGQIRVLTSRALSGYMVSDMVLNSQWSKEIKDLSADSNVIASVAADPGRIGLVALTPDLPKDVKLVAIAKDAESTPVRPTVENVVLEKYPLVRQYKLILSEKSSPAAHDFATFACSKEAAKIVQQWGLFPVEIRNEAEAEKRLSEVKQGQGTPIAVCDLMSYEELLKDLSLEFVRAKAAVQLKFQRGGTGDEGVEGLAKGTTELLLTDGALSEGKNNPRRIELGRMVVGVIVHPDNPLESLPLDEVKGIFTGEIKKWPAVRGAAAAMRVVGLRHDDPITELLREKLIAGERGKGLKYTVQPGTEKVILAVARDPAAIGFVEISQLPPTEKSVKLVKVLGETSAKSTKDAKDIALPVPLAADSLPEDYPLARTLTLYVSPRASQVAKDFADFLTPEHCKEIIAQYNLLPPLHTVELAKAAKPARERPPVRLASADEPIPLLLDDPDAPQEQTQAKAKTPVARAKPGGPASEQPEPAKPASDAESVAASEPTGEPTQGQPGAASLSDKETIWLVCGVAGVVVLAIGVGWLSASKRKKPRRYAP